MKAQNLLVTTTRHLTPRTAKLLSKTRAVDWPSPGGHYADMGFFFWAVDENGVGRDFIPPDLFDVLEHANAMGFDFVLLQDVAEACPELTVYRRESDEVGMRGYQLEKPGSQDLDDVSALLAQEAVQAAGIDGDISDEDLSVKISAVLDNLSQKLKLNPSASYPHLKADLQFLIDLACALATMLAKDTFNRPRSLSMIEVAVSRVSEWLDGDEPTASSNELRIMHALNEAHYRLGNVLAA